MYVCVYIYIYIYIYQGARGAGDAAGRRARERRYIRSVHDCRLTTFLYYRRLAEFFLNHCRLTKEFFIAAAQRRSAHPRRRVACPHIVWYGIV